MTSQELLDKLIKKYKNNDNVWGIEVIELNGHIKLSARIIGIVWKLTGKERIYKYKNYELRTVIDKDSSTFKSEPGFHHITHLRHLKNIGKYL